MAVRYTSKIEINCWKEHVCSGCGSAYSYRFTRKVIGNGRNKEQAEKQAHANVMKTMEREVDAYPCPSCGLYQPDMVGQQRAKWHKRLFWCELILFATLLIVRATDAVQANVATWWIFSAAAIAAVAHALVELKNPNSDLDANRALAADLLAAGKIHFTPGPPAVPADELIAPRRSIAQRIAIPLLVICIVLVVLPELLRSGAHWPLNADCYPPVVGPGDQTRIYMNDSIHSVKGYWRGTPHVEIAAGSDAPIGASATTNDNDWGTNIYAKSDETNNKSTPWVRIQMPVDGSLANQTVNCRIDLEVSYPAVTGSSNFQETSTNMSRNVTIRLAPANAGERYNSTWWTGTSLGVLMILFIAQLLRAAGRSLQKQAKPTKILT